MRTFSGRDVLYGKRRCRRAYRPSPVDAFEQHRELCAAQTDRSFIRLRPDEASAFETFGKEAQTVAIPPQHFHQIAAPAPENEHVAGVRILFEHRLSGGAQTSETAAHVGHAGSDPDARRRRQRDHRPSCSRMVRSVAGSTGPSTRMRARPISIWIAPPTPGATG